MSTKSSLYACEKCGAQALKWAGRCDTCGAWGTLKEETLDLAPTTRVEAPAGKVDAFSSLTSSNDHSHMPTGLAAWDRILSGGFVAGSVTLLGGEPGIGKSTLVAQLALALAQQQKNILYVTGEESPHQILLRLKRLTGNIPSTLKFLDHMRADVIAGTIEKELFDLVIIDSIQTMRLPNVSGEAGNPSQVKASSSLVTEAAKRRGSPLVLIGQVTKEGELAGPKLVEHLVDTVLMMEGDRQHTFRLLRVYKHRFGSTDELAVFSMSEKGLEEVLDPSAALIADRPANTSGSVVTCLAQGSKPFLVEIQALVTNAGYGTPLRRATGVDTNRLSLLLAVLGRRGGVHFADQDVFVNVVGGIEAKEPATDLAICLALVSAKNDVPIPRETIAWGEVGLSGEVRPVSNIDARIKEASRHGFSTFVVPPNAKQKNIPGSIINNCASVKDALSILSLLLLHVRR